MNLKESYRYANFLDGLLNTSGMYLRNRNFVTTTKQNHQRSKANAEAVDETIEVQKPYDEAITPNKVINFTVKVLAEKQALVDAIAKAKAGTEINIDNAITMNKKKQAFVSNLKLMDAIKASERQTTGKDYKFDVNGEQKPYTYNVLETTSIDFDRNDVKGLIKKLNKECDEASAKLDEIEITTIVNFEPSFDLNDTFEDLVTA
jgi:hypothetical protein